MRLRFLVAIALMLLAGPAFAAKVYIDFDADYDFSKIETFAWSETSETSLESTNPLMHSRIVNAIEHYATMAGMREVKTDPDIYITYHTSTKENLSLNTTSFGYGYPGAWGGGWYGRYGYGYGYGYGGAFATGTTTVSTWETGTLIVDAWDPHTDKLVWRGTATDVTVSPNPDKMEKKIDSALKKIIKKWQKMRVDAS